MPRSPRVVRADGPLRRLSGLAPALALALAAPAAADPIFASELVSSTDATPFLGGNVLGSPDRSGIFLGSSIDPPMLPGALVLRFSLPVADGEGVDLIVVDVDRDLRNETELAEVAVSPDGDVWSSLGDVFGGVGEGQIDFAGRIAVPVSFVRVTQLSEAALDVDAVQANYPIPEPGALALVAGGLVALARLRRRTP